MKKAEMKVYKERLMSLRSRLRGDVNQMADSALKKTRSELNGDLSSMPIHMADIGSDNFEQEFTLSLMENEEGTLDAIETALERIVGRHVRRLRGMQREDSQGPAERDSVCCAVRQVRRAGRTEVLSDFGKSNRV